MGLHSGRRSITAVAILATLLATTPATAETGPAVTGEADGIAWGEIGSKTFDVIVLRPLGAVATVAGTAFFIVTLPVVAPARGWDTTLDVFVLAPADYTFVRPLGDF